MNRSALSLIGVTAALAAVTGIATLTGAGTPEAAPAASAARLPVERSTLTCPAPSDSDFATTQYTSFTPKGDSAGSDGSARLLPAAGQDGKAPKSPKGGAKPVAPLKAAGKPVTATTRSTDAPALIGTADGALAPGWTVQQTTVIDAGPARAVLGTSCAVPDSEFWFPAVSTASSRQDYVHLTNPDDNSAVVDLELYGPKGEIKTDTGDGITVPPGASVPVLLSTLTTEKTDGLTLHVSARSGRVGASVEAIDAKAGGDWLAASADPSDTLVMPGIPADATSVRLVVFATGDDDADLKLRLAASGGEITPAGHETVHVKSGMTTTVDLGDVTKGEAGSLVLSPSGTTGSAPVVAALRITRGKGANQETAFLPATEPVGDRSTAADNRGKGSTLALTAPKADATVKVTTSAATSGGEPVSKTLTVKAGTTVSLSPPAPSGKGTYAVTVQPSSGGPVYASRMLALPQDGVPMFTVQPMPDDGGLVAVPTSREDLSILN
ncbi:DUF5719 family protein [Streptomyces sp. NPDC058691]|uniref:DUF5719 family protein n=1 Tax=Streptomyces sp. NPDC058691 TaxID=3346601 RepID=UPI0036680DA7